MSFSTITATGDGVTKDFAVTFDYLDQSHVRVRVNKIGTEEVGSLYKFSFINPTTVRVDTVAANAAPGVGELVEIIRQTPIDTPAVVFSTGPSLTAENLNKNAMYLTYALQEATDANEAFTKLYLGSFAVAPTTDNDGDPLQVGAVYYDTTETALFYWTGTEWIIGESTFAATQARDAALVAQTAAEVARAAAEAAAAAAQSSQTAAAGSAAAADADATAASASEIAAAASAAAALASQNAAAASQAAAASSATSASNSATTATTQASSASTSASSAAGSATTAQNAASAAAADAAAADADAASAAASAAAAAASAAAAATFNPADFAAVAGDTLTGGFTNSGITALGNISSGTTTLSPAGNNFFSLTVTGAFTLAAPTVSGNYTMVGQITIGAGAGAVTFSGFTRDTGDELTTVNGNVFLAHVTVIGAIKHIHITAMQ